MDDLKEKYPKKSIYMIHYEDDTSFDIPLKVLHQPFDYAPTEQLLTKQEEELLAKLEKQNSWEGKDFLTLSKLELKRGNNDKQAKLRSEKLENLLKECSEKGLKLPLNFIKLFQEDKLFNRFRLGSSVFTLPRKVTYFSEKKDIFIICFHQDWQCCFRYYLVIDLKGDHCIMLNHNTEGYPYEDTENYSPDALEFFVCADSFEEYIIKIAFLIRMYEGEKDLLWE